MCRFIFIEHHRSTETLYLSTAGKIEKLPVAPVGRHSKPKTTDRPLNDRPLEIVCFYQNCGGKRVASGKVQKVVLRWRETSEGISFQFSILETFPYRCYCCSQSLCSRWVWFRLASSSVKVAILHASSCVEPVWRCSQEVPVGSSFVSVCVCVQGRLSNFLKSSTRLWP